MIRFWIYLIFIVHDLLKKFVLFFHFNFDIIYKAQKKT